MYKKILCLSGIAVLGILATTRVSYGAEHDEGGYSVEEPLTPSVGNPNVSVTQFDPSTGTISGGIVDTPIEVGSSSSSGSGSGAGEGLGSSSGRGTGRGVPSESPQEISLNDAATLMENSLDTSIETLAAVERQSRISSNTRRNVLDEDTRRIVREKNSCPVPNRLSAEADREIQARKVLEQQIAQSQMFIEQVNSTNIDPDKNLW